MQKIILLTAIILINIKTQAQIYPGLIAHWMFNGNLADSSGNAINGNGHNVTSATGIDGIPNTAYSFDGQSSYITAGYKPVLNLTTWTMTAIVRPDAFYSGTCQSNFIFKRGAEGALGGYGMVVYDNAYNGCATSDPSKFVFAETGYTNALPESAFQYSPNVVLQTWYRIAGTYDGTSLKTYVNGQLKSTMPTAPGSVPVSTDSIIMGRNYSNFVGYPYWYHGLIDDIQLYDHALTATELENSGCSKFIATQPVNASTYIGNNTSFTTSITSANALYQWQVNSGTGFVNASGTGYAGINTATLTVIAPTSSMNNYTYRCVISNLVNCQDTTTPAKLTVKDPTGINDVQFKNMVNIFPNPSNGQFTISLPYAGHHITVKIFDMIGKKVLETNNIEVITKLAKGIYIVKIIDEDSRQSTIKELAIQ